MINFTSTTNFVLNEKQALTSWIENAIYEEGKDVLEVDYNFCSDEELLKINVEFLNHDTFTDIISFDYTVGNSISGEIYISIDRVYENADQFKVSFEDELKRVLIHGILHFCGYKDKSKEDVALMRSKEDFYLLKSPIIKYNL